MVKTQNFCPPEVDDISLRKNKGLGSILRDMIMSQLVLSDLTEEVNMSGDTGKTPKSFANTAFWNFPLSRANAYNTSPCKPLPSALNQRKHKEQDKETENINLGSKYKRRQKTENDGCEFYQ